jgi:hypothetical protein
MKRKIIAILLATLMSATMFAGMPVTTAATYHMGTAPDDLEIQQVLMDDYVLRSAAMGGQEVDIGVDVKNIGTSMITEDFEVYLFINQVSYLIKGPGDENLSPGETVRVYFDDVEISRGVGSYTLDAYINDDLDTREYCNFEVTIFGVNQ